MVIDTSAYDAEVLLGSDSSSRSTSPRKKGGRVRLKFRKPKKGRAPRISRKKKSRYLQGVNIRKLQM